MGLAVGSFASVSLDPALVAFFPDQGSSSWPHIEAAGSFCVNILAEDQEVVCRRFATKGDDKFVGLGWRPAASGAPLLDGVLAWIECAPHATFPGGDHTLVVGHVLNGGTTDGAPLVYFRGGYTGLTRG